MNEIDKNGFKMTLRPMVEEEKKFAYIQPANIFEVTGCIGFLRADLDRDGPGFYSTWQDIRFYWKSDSFREEFDKVINSLRFDEEFQGVLKNRVTMGKYCRGYKESKLNNPKEYGFRADTGKYCYLIRLNPTSRDYNFSCFCYNASWFDDHLERARHGVKFIDENYDIMFYVKDGGKALFKYENGFEKEETIRFVDDHNFICGENIPVKYHINEIMQKKKEIGLVIKPIDEIKKNKEFKIEKEKKRKTKENLYEREL